jgi:integrase
MAALSHAFTVAMKEWHWVEDNPFRKVTKPREPKGRTRFLADEERLRLLQACKAAKSRYLYPIVVLALSTGMRFNEIMTLRWKDIDFEQGKVVLHETKNKDVRVVALVGVAHKELKELSKVRRIDTDLVFPNSMFGDLARPFEIRKHWDAALAAAKIDDFRFHDLRHSAASYLAMNGASLSEIAEVLGHRTLQMVKRYSHFSQAHTKKVVESMNAKIFSTNA